MSKIAEEVIDDIDNDNTIVEDLENVVDAALGLSTAQARVDTPPKRKAKKGRVAASSPEAAETWTPCECGLCHKPIDTMEEAYNESNNGTTFVHVKCHYAARAVDNTAESAEEKAALKYAKERMPDAYHHRVQEQLDAPGQY